jgi:hypothetical protein
MGPVGPGIDSGLEQPSRAFGAEDVVDVVEPNAKKEIEDQNQHKGMNEGVGGCPANPLGTVVAVKPVMATD